MAEKTFRVTLEGLIHGWGSPSVDNVRNTAVIPEKRGIVGLLACCMGLKRGDPRIRNIYDSVKVDVTIDDDYAERYELLHDYQTVNGLPVSLGSNELTRFPTAKGDTKAGGIIRHKYYITDAVYYAYITAEEDLAEELYKAVEDPKWIPYFGRKCCLPSAPLAPTWIQ